MTPDEEVRRAQKAKEVLGNELFQQAVKAIEEALLLGIRHSAFKDKDLREKLCDRYCMLHEIVGQLQVHIETGELAQSQSLMEKVKEKVREHFA